MERGGYIFINKQLEYKLSYRYILINKQLEYKLRYR